MNILQQEDMIKGLPDDALMQEAQAPSGQVPQFLVVSEIQRRSDMRKRYQEQQQPQGTVAEQIVGQAQQGIAAMQPQAGPMPPQAMPPQGMPPQGMPPQMPPQQMFSGGIIRLSNGGSTALDRPSVERPFYPTRANAGREDILPRGMTVRDKIQLAIQQGATMADLLSVFRNSPDVLEEIRMMYNKERMVDLYRPTSADILSDKFAGDTRRELIQDPSVSDMDKAAISNDLAADMTADKIGSQFNYFQPPAFIGDFIQSGIGAMQKLPSDQDMIDFYRSILPEPPERGAAEEAGRQFGEKVRNLMPEVGVTGLPQRSPETVAADRARVESIREGISPLSEGISPLGTYGSSPEEFAAQRGRIPDLGIGSFFSDMRERGAQSLDETAANRQFIADLASGELADSFQPDSVRREKSRLASAERMAGIAPESLASEPAFFSDLLSEYDSMMPRPSGAERQGSSKIQRQATDQDAVNAMEQSPGAVAALYGQEEPTVPELTNAIAEGQKNLNDASKKTPSLDLSDLIEDAKRMTRANALMQLGAGIAAGDLSQGLSRAGVAAAQGDQREKAIAIRERLAEYNAGRQDLDRQQKESQFNRRLALMEEQLKATIKKGERVSRAQLMNMATELAIEAVPEFGVGEDAPTVQGIFNDLLRKYAPFMDVDVKTLPPSETVKAGRTVSFDSLDR